MLEKKPLPLLDAFHPRKTFENVLPPVSKYLPEDGKEISYLYFRDQASCSFRHDSGKFELVNAWFLADAAMLAYSDAAFIQNACRPFASGFRFFSGTSTQCYVVDNGVFAIAAFRGTQAPKDGQSLQDVLTDWFMDSQITLVDSGHGGFIHSGFKRAIEEIWEPAGKPSLLQYLNQLHAEKPGMNIWFTGHSLGAALATVAADWFGAAKGLYTYGSPLVGDRDFVGDYGTPAYRIVNDKDLVTQVPKFGPYVPARAVEFGEYRHVTDPMTIDSNGRLHDSREAASRTEDALRPLLRTHFTLSGLLHRNLADDAVVGKLIDHAPLLYTLHLWNALVDDRS